MDDVGKNAGTGGVTLRKIMMPKGFLLVGSKVGARGCCFCAVLFVSRKDRPLLTVCTGCTLALDRKMYHRMDVLHTRTAFFVALLFFRNM